MNNLLILSERFPLNGQEPVMYDEIRYTSALFDQVYIMPNYPEGVPANVPDNCKVMRSSFDNVRIRKYLMNCGWRMVKLMLSELIKSKNRFWYLRNLTKTVHILLGLKNNVYRLKEMQGQLEKGTLLYSFWFNNWVTACYIAGIEDHFKVVTRIRGYDFDKRQSAYGFILFRSTLCNYPQRILSISAYGKDYFKVHHPRAYSKVEVFRLGVEETAEINLPSDNSLTFVSVASAIPLKRLSLTIELLSHIKSPFTWHYYGEGHLIEELKALAKTKLPEGSYIFHGQCKREEIFALYKSAGISAMIHTSELEGIPVSLMEAASFGIPIIACDTCGVGEITNSHTGILLPLDFNIAQTAAHIETFCREKGNTIEFRNSVKKYCSEFFNIKLNATRTAKRLKELSQT